MGDIEYSDVYHEVKGALAQGRLRLTEQNIIFKNSKTGKVDNLNAGDIDLINWQKFVNTCGLRIFLKNGTLHRYHGFKESEQEKIAKFIKSSYSKELAEKEMSVKGWNWGTAKFSGALMSFDVGRDTAFEVPLNYVSQCTTGKNEVTVEFHQNDDAPVSLMEMRFHIPTSELAGEDPVDAFHQNVMNQASVISVSGDALAIVREIPCLNPRGRYDIKMYSSFFQLHGKTFDYKIPAHSVLRLFLLPHPDKRQIFFVVSLDPPIKQGQTRYHYVVFLFPLEDDEINVELPYSEEELKTKFEGKLTKEIKGQAYEVIGQLMKVVVGRKLTTPSFVGKSDSPAITCSYKAASGYIYPLERGFMYLRKPPFYVRFEEIASVNFARSGGSTRSFDFEIETKSGTIHTFSSIEKDEYGKLFDYITAKKLNVKNRGKNDKPMYSDDLVDSDQEEPDAYLARVKREAQERDDDDGGSEDESTDEDFKPNQEESDVAEEYDSDAPDSSDSDDAGSGGSGAEKKDKKEKKQKKAKTVSEKPRKKREKRAKDPNAPKKPMSAYFFWMNENRDKVKQPGMSVSDVGKKCGELWRELADKSEWEEKAKEAKASYESAMAEYKSSGGGGEETASSKSTKKKSSAKPTHSPDKSMTGAGFKSKEYISDSDSDSKSDDDDKSAKKDSKTAKSKPSKSKPTKAKSPSGSESDSKTSKAKPSKSKPTKAKSPSGSESDSKTSKAKPSKSKPSKAKSPSGSESDESDKDKKDDSESEKEPSPKKRRRRGGSDKGAGDKDEVIAEEDDEFPEDPEEDTPPTTSDENASDNDSD